MIYNSYTPNKNIMRWSGEIMKQLAFRSLPPIHSYHVRIRATSAPICEPPHPFSKNNGRIGGRNFGARTPHLSFLHCMVE